MIPSSVPLFLLPASYFRDGCSFCSTPGGLSVVVARPVAFSSEYAPDSNPLFLMRGCLYIHYIPVQLLLYIVVLWHSRVWTPWTHVIVYDCHVSF